MVYIRNLKIKIISFFSQRGDFLESEISRLMERIQTLEYVYRYRNNKDSLTDMEIDFLKVIKIMNNKTISQLSEFMNISLPNISYKINILEKKGYIKKMKSQFDKRECYVMGTEKLFKFFEYERNVITQLNIALSSINAREIITATKLVENLIAESFEENQED